MKILSRTSFRRLALGPTTLLLAAAALFVACAATQATPIATEGTPRSTVWSAELTPATAATPDGEVVASTQTVCELACERAQILPRSSDGPDYNANANANANTVLDAMHADLLACYKSRVAVNPQAHGFITVDILVDEHGSVRSVETTGGAILGEVTMGCIVGRIRRATFDPPHGGGSQHIQVPFSLRRQTPGDDAM